VVIAYNAVPAPNEIRRPMIVRPIETRKTNPNALSSNRACYECARYLPGQRMVEDDYVIMGYCTAKKSNIITRFGSDEEEDNWMCHFFMDEDSE
jgi:hypothetical protein